MEGPRDPGTITLAIVTIVVDAGGQLYSFAHFAALIILTATWSQGGLLGFSGTLIAVGLLRGIV